MLLAHANMKTNVALLLLLTGGSCRRTCKAPTVDLGSRPNAPAVSGNISRWEGVSLHVHKSFRVKVSTIAETTQNVHGKTRRDKIGIPFLSVLEIY